MIDAGPKVENTRQNGACARPEPGMLRVDGCYGTHWTSDSILRRDSASDAQSKIDGRPSEVYFSVGRPSEDTSDAFPSHFRHISLLPTGLPKGLKLSDGGGRHRSAPPTLQWGIRYNWI